MPLPFEGHSPHASRLIPPGSMSPLRTLAWVCIVLLMPIGSFDAFPPPLIDSFPWAHPTGPMWGGAPIPPYWASVSIHWAPMGSCVSRFSGLVPVSFPIWHTCRVC